MATHREVNPISASEPSRDRALGYRANTLKHLGPCQLLGTGRTSASACGGWGPSDQYTGLNGVVVPGTLRDSLVLLSVVLEQETELKPVEIMTDTGAYTDAIFGIFYLLGFQFSPRLADAGGARLWRIDPKADYGAFNRLASDRVSTKLIAEQWDDLLRLAGSLKLGVVQASGLIRTLQTNNSPTRLARALAELGRIIKTIHLLNYFDDEAYRRRILVQLNRGEGRHMLSRTRASTARSRALRAAALRRSAATRSASAMAFSSASSASSSLTCPPATLP
jgi:TnpA family transposase